MTYLHYKNISIKPVCVPQNWENIDLNATIEFGSSQKIYNGLPLILSSVWSLEHVQQMTSLGVLSAHGAMSADMLVSYYRHQDLTHRTIYEIDMSRQEEVVHFFVVMSQVVDKSKMKYVRLNFNNVSQSSAIEATKQIRQTLPHMVIIAGPCITYEHADAITDAGADIVSLGHPYGTGFLHLLRQNGGDISEVELIQKSTFFNDTTFKVGKAYLAETWCSTPGDVAKCIALGADFVGIGPDLNQFTIENIVDGLRYACSISGSDNITEYRQKVIINGLPD